MKRLRQYRLVAAVVLIAVGASLVGWDQASTIGAAPSAAVSTRITTRTHTHFVTLRVKGRVLHRYDHVLVVFVPKTIFHTHTTPRRKIIVPAHIVRIKRRQESAPPFAATSLIIGVTPPPVTVEVPVTVTVPGPTTTITEPVTFTQTDTVTADPVTVTVTVTVPFPPPEGQP